jgi:hypothetical protein
MNTKIDNGGRQIKKSCDQSAFLSVCDKQHCRGAGACHDARLRPHYQVTEYHSQQVFLAIATRPAVVASQTYSVTGTTLFYGRSSWLCLFLIPLLVRRGVAMHGRLTLPMRQYLKCGSARTRWRCVRWFGRAI